MYEQIKLPYGYDALEPVIGRETVETHYAKHHATYTTNLNNAAEGAGLSDKPIEELLADIASIPDNAVRTAITNNGGGFYNHNIYFEQLRAPKEDNAPDGELLDKINETFGSFDEFKTKMSALAVGQFGSGWAWLSCDGDGTLALSQSANQENPITQGTGRKILLTIDVWEHAYYLDYKNLRAKYVDEIWKLINWDVVAKRYADAVA